MRPTFQNYPLLRMNVANAIVHGFTGPRCHRADQLPFGDGVPVSGTWNGRDPGHLDATIMCRSLTLRLNAGRMGSQPNGGAPFAGIRSRYPLRTTADSARSGILQLCLNRRGPISLVWNTPV